MVIAVSISTAKQQQITALLQVICQVAHASLIDLFSPGLKCSRRHPSLQPWEQTGLEALAKHILSSRQMLLIEDIQQRPDVAQVLHPTIANTQTEPLQFYAGFPVVHADEIVGVISVMARQPHTLTPSEKNTIATLANHMGCVISSTKSESDAHFATPTWLLPTTGVEQEDFAVVMRLSMALQSCLSFEDLTNKLIALLPEQLPISAFELTLRQGRRLSRAICSWPSDDLSVPSDEALLKKTSDDFPTSQFVRAPADAKEPPSFNWRSYQLRVRELHIADFKLCILPQAVHHFPYDSHILSNIADQIGVTVHRLLLLNRLQSENLQDPLTKLFNRRHMMCVLAKLLKRVSYGDYQVGFIMFDLDHFKRLNDTYGHDAGDQILRMIGLFLKGHARPNDIVCRYGGEEFALILPGLTWDILERRAHQLCRSIRYLSLKVDQTSLSVTLSAGFAIAPLQARTPSTLIKAADEALYLAKRAGRDRAVGAPLPNSFLEN